MAWIRDWRERELDERLRKQFEERGFYLLNDGPVRHAPLPAGFNNTERTEQYLEELQAEYRYVAFPDEQIMLLHRDGVVVMFLETTGDLDRIEQEMHLQRTVEYPNMQLPPLNRKEE